MKDKPKDPVEQDSAEPKTTSKRASRKAPQPKPKTVRKAVEPERPTRKAAEAVTHPADKRIHTPPSTALTSARSPSRDPIDSMSGSAVDVAEVLPFGAAVGVPPDLDAASPESPSPNCVSPPSPDFITAIEGEKASPKVSKLHPRPQEAESDDSDGEEVDSRGRTGLWAKEVINEAPPEPLSPAAVAIQAEAKPARSSPQTPCLAMQPFTDQRQQVAPHQTPNAPSITAETIDLPRVHPTYESNSHDDNISMKTLRILHANGMNISPLFGIPALNSQWGPPPPSINVHSVAHEKYHVQHDFNEHLFTPSQPKRLPDMGRPPLPRRSLPAPPSMSTVPHTPSIASGTDRSLMRDVMNGHSKPSLSKSSPPDNSSLPPKLPTVLNLRDLLRGSNVPPDLADSLAESLEAQLGLAESKYRTQQNLRDQDLEREVEAARGRWMNDKRVAEAEYASLLDAHNFRVRTQAHSLIKLASRDSQVRKLVDMEDQDELEKLVQYLNNEVCWTGPGRVRDMRTLMVDPNVSFLCVQSEQADSVA